MKRIVILLLSFIFLHKANAQLTIYSGFNLQGSSANCISKSIFTDNSIPGGLNNRILSIALDSGFMATLAENADGTGERFTYMANKSAIRVNLSIQLQNNVSFIRVLKLPTVKVKKKGVCSTNNKEIDSIGNTTWFYDWNDKDVSLPTREYAPMAFMWYSVRDSFITKLINKDSVTHYIAFNEPDVTGPSRMFVSQAIPAFKKMQTVGLRMGSPSASYRVWQDTFAREAKAQKLRIDYVCLHWYDWGAYMTTHPDSIVSAAGILSRLKSFIEAVYDYYRKPIWLTEFNANEHRTDSVHIEFMKIALPWLDSCKYVERYSYFFGNDVRSINTNGSLTAAGKFYADHPSVDAYPENIYDTRSAFPISLAAWQSSSILQGGVNQATLVPTKINSDMSVPMPFTRGQGLLLPPTNSSNGYWGASSFSTTTADAAIADKKFFSFSLKSKNGETVNYHSISKINIRIGSTGPIKYLIDYTVDDGRTFIIDSIIGPARVTGNYTLDSVDLAGISNLQNISPSSTVTFRIIPYDATGTGVFLIGSGVNDTLPDFEINGSYSENNLITTSLPVKLSTFQLQQTSLENVHLKWATSSEVNFSHFELQRSVNATSFEHIATIAGKDYSNGSNYSYTDRLTHLQPVYYRLKVIDKDGTFTFSNVLRLELKDNLPSFNIYPSVSSGEMLTVEFKNLNTQTNLKIITPNGKLISTYKLMDRNGIQNIQTTHLKKGMYILVLEGKDIVFNKKIIIQ